MSTFKNSLILLLCFVFTNTFSQTFNWSGFGAGTGAGPRNYTTGNMSAIVTATTGGGQIGYSYGSTTQISGSGFCGGTPNNGLLLEMRGGTSAWTAQINVAITFSTPVCGPVTFSIYDINEAIWSGDNSSYYNDQVVISATDQSATAINPTNINYSGCPAAANTSIVGNTRIITGKITNNTCNCATASITINPGAAQVKTINLLYRNGPPNISKYGVLQFQNIVLSSIVASPPPTAAITSPTLACGITSTILTATTSASSPTYSWTGPGGSTVTSPTASATAVSGAGVYTVVINPGGCSSTATYNIGSGGIPPTVTASASNTLNCTTTTVQAIVSTTSTPVTYNWSGPSVTGGATTASASVNSPGTYNYTVTNTSTGCSTTGTLAIAQNTSVVTASTSATSSLNCTTTTAQIIASTTTTPVSYNWSGTGITGGAGTATINVNQGGTFNYTITNTSNGCRTTGSQAISQNTVLPSPTASSAGSITCSTSTVALNGGPAALTYTWSGPGFSGGVNTQNVIATATGNYTLAVTGTNGCTNTAVTTVGTNTSLPSPTASSTGSITCSTSTVALNGGPAALTYTWSGPGFSGGTNSQNAVATVAGSYTLTVRGANGCTNTAVTSVTTNTISPTATALSSVINCTNTISTLTGGPLSGVTYSWSGLGLSGSTTSSTASATVAGTYTLTTTSTANGCTNTAVTTVSSNTTVPQITVGPDLTLNCVVSTVTLSGSSSTPGVTYSWTGPTIGSPAGSTPTNSTSVVSSPGLYTLTLTDPTSGCTSTALQSVSNNVALPDISLTSSTQTLTCASPSSTLTGSSITSGVTYSWNPGGSTPTSSTTIVNTGGTYTLTITDPGSSCISTSVVTISSNTTIPTLTLSPTAYTTTCAVPTITLMATSSADPDASYTWTVPSTGSLNNTTSSSPVASGSGVFTVQVTNTVSSCSSAVATVTITADANTPVLTATASSTSICANQTLTLNISGADTYTWVTNENTPSITVSPSVTTTYSVTGTNTTTGCSNVTNITITVNPTPTVSILSVNNPSICLGNNSIITPTGASTYTLEPGTQTGTTFTVSPTTTTTYTITGTSVEGCLAGNTATTTITLNPTPTVSILSVNNPSICLGDNSIITPTGASTYTLEPGTQTGTTFTVSPTTTTTYTITGTSVEGCLAANNATTTITLNQSPTVTASSNPGTTCITGTVNITANTTATSYTWTLGNGVDNTNQNNQTVTFPANGLTPGTYTYTVSVTSAEGCTSTPATTTLTIIDVPNANFDLSDLSICQNQGGIISINNAQTGVNYDWSINGQTITNTNPLALPASVTSTAGTYTVNAIASIGSCSNTAAGTLTVNTLPVITLVSPQVSACENTSAQLDVAGPSPTQTYIWSYNTQTITTGPSITINPLTNANSGTYTVSTTDANGCVNSTTGTVDIQICDIYVPEIFTPNGDGKNDDFVIKNIENYPNNNLKIFNRWGNKIYEKDKYQNEFSGYANTGDQVGKSKLPAGTYYVILDYGDGKTETYNGYLLLQY